MVTNKGQFISIENGLTSFSLDSTQFTQYTKRVKSLLESLSSKNVLSEVLPEFLTIDQKFMEFTGLTIDDLGTLAIQEGFIEFIKNSPKLAVNKTQLENWKSALGKFQPPLVGLSSINIDYICAMLDLFREYGKKMST